MKTKIVKINSRFFIQKGWFFHSYLDSSKNLDKKYWREWWSSINLEFLMDHCSFLSIESAEEHFNWYKENLKKHEAKLNIENIKDLYEH